MVVFYQYGNHIPLPDDKISLYLSGSGFRNMWLLELTNITFDTSVLEFTDRAGSKYLVSWPRDLVFEDYPMSYIGKTFVVGADFADIFYMSGPYNV